MEPKKLSELLPAVTANLGQAPHKSQPIRITSNDEKLLAAISETKLHNAPEEELKQCLVYVYALIGLRAQNLPQAEARIFLHGFIRQHYGGHTAAEIRLAFEMALTGKLDVDPVCYENFSPVYFSGIMNAFRTWAAAQVRKIEWKIVEERPKTKDEIVDINCEYAFYLFKKINKLPCKR